MAWCGAHDDNMLSCQENGANVETREKMSADLGSTLLMLSCEHDQEDTVKSLIEHGADINVSDEHLNTSLMYASHYGHEGIVKTLLQYGADTKKCNNYGETALIIACSCGYENVVKLLLQYGSPTDCVNRHGQTALTWAWRNRHDGIVRLVLQAGGNVNARYKNGKSALITASEIGMEETVEFLLHSGADLNIRCDEGKTALMYASLVGMENIVESLLKAGADVHIKCNEGKSALIYSSKNGSQQIVRSLLQSGACVNELYYTKRKSALICAAQNGMEEIVECLLQAGADLDIQCGDGKTALMYASEYRGWEKIVQFLLRAGADVNIQCRDGKSALMYAAKSGKGSHVLESLLRSGADVNLQCKRGRTALMEAIIRGNDVYLQKMVDVGANLEVLDGEGSSVFSYAMGRSDTNCLRVLLNDGKVLNQGRLKEVHRGTGKVSYFSTLNSLLMTIGFGVFEWDWCCYNDLNWNPMSAFHNSYFGIFDSYSEVRKLILAAFKFGYCPGKIKYRNTDTAILVLCFLKNDTEAVKLFIDNLYFLPEDFVVLSTDEGIKSHIPNRKLLDTLTRQPPSLQTWSYLHISRAIALSGPPGRRPQRVDSLPIPELMKRRLNFTSGGYFV